MNTEYQNKHNLSNLGIECLNEMQMAAQKTIINEQNVLLLSPTGSGKTIAVLLPVLQIMDENISNIQCLIVVPSRELALQTEQVWKKLGTKFKVNVCYGGHSMETELNNLNSPPALLIGTPGRLTDHLERKSFNTDFIKTLILDEFDKSLQLGFQEEMNTITSHLPNLSKRVLLSATSDVEIPGFVGIESPVTLDFLEEDKSEALKLKIVESPEKDKLHSLFHLICTLDSEPALIFCNHRESTQRVVELLNKKGVGAGYYHGGMDQDDRERILIKFRNGSLNYLVTTDLAARGLDIPEMNHVIHYHLPGTETEFIHRNGRTARMFAKGTAYIIHYKEDKLPDYIPDNLEVFKVSTKNKLPDQPKYETIYVSGGKKNKLNKGDIVGFFLQKGKLDKSEIGLIEVKDFISFVAVRTTVVKKLLANIRNEKMKGKKYKIEIARTL